MRLLRPVVDKVLLQLAHHPPERLQVAAGPEVGHPPEA